ncbi:MAG: endonuclease III domain-containing protein [Candidatus Helarchaeota archaeon]
MLNEIRNQIENWYQYKWENKLNTYPWRIGKKSPYEILIAEILLQHTTAKAVIENNSYEIFLDKFPNINKLNKASIHELRKIFLPLGLYNQKSERIKKLAAYIVKNYNGIIPNNKKQLKQIPGIGDYITNAILTFAFGQNEVPLDNNLKRIAFNVWKIKDKKDLIEIYKKLASPNPKLIYWALFDIGRYHCRKPIPKCNDCPLFKWCKNKIL